MSEQPLTEPRPYADAPEEYFSDAAPIPEDTELPFEEGGHGARERG